MNGSGKTLTRVRVARAFQQRCCFFAVTSVTLEVKNERRKESISHKRRRKKGVFLRFIVENLRGEIALLLKYILKTSVINCPLRGYT